MELYMARSCICGAAWAIIVWRMIAGGSFVCGQDSNCGIQPHAETQRVLELLVAATMDRLDRQKYYRIMFELDQLSIADGPELVRQTILYDVTHKPPFPVWILTFQLKVGVRDWMTAIAPLLYCDNTAIRDTARKFLGILFVPRPSMSRFDVSDFSDLFISTGPFHMLDPRIATPLRRALFEAVPGTVFLLYADRDAAGDEIRPYYRKWRVIDNALFEKHWLGGIPGGRVDQATADVMRELAASKYWWSRLFVAEIMVQNKEFRDPELVKQLEQDENELVRNSIASLSKPDPLRITPVDQ
jgi:hypothetical protein